MIKRMFALKSVTSGVLSLALLATIFGSANFRSVSVNPSTVSVESVEVTQSHAITDLQSYAGGDKTGCQLVYVGLGLALLGSAVAITIATGGAGAPVVALVVAGSYAPLGAAIC